MNIIDIPLDGEYQSDSLSISNQSAVNCYINIPQTPSFTASTLLGTPGIKEIVTTGSIKQVNRGCHVMAGLYYFVNGEKLYRLEKAEEEFFTTEIGDIPGTARCSFADNGKQLMIVVDGNGWIVDESANPVLQAITDTDLKANGDPQRVVFLDGYFVVTTDTKKIITSSLNDGTSWNALNFASAEADPDNIVSSLVNRNRLFVGGSETIEVFENLGLGGFPFQRVNGFVIAKGVYSPFGMVNVGDSLMWIGGGTNESPAIWLLNGSNPQKVSTTAIDSDLQDMSSADLQESFTFSYAQNGAIFVGFSFPRVTYVYDLITNKWHERQSQIITLNNDTVNIRYRVNSLATAYGEVICGDSQTGQIGILSPDVYTEYGMPILREFSTITLYNQTLPFFIPFVELTMESGVGNLAQPDPEIRLDYSSNGKSFNNERARKVGKTGEYGTRQVWRSLGRFARMAVIRFKFSDPCKFAALKLNIGITSGQ